MFSPSYQREGEERSFAGPATTFHQTLAFTLELVASVLYLHPFTYRQLVLKYFSLTRNTTESKKCLTLLFCATATSTVENETFCSSPLQRQIRSRNKYFVFYWQTQVFDEEKVNHYMNNLYKQMLLSNLFSFFATASKVSRC